VTLTDMALAFVAGLLVLAALLQLAGVVAWRLWRN
jgi:hypothetical protein